MASQVPTSFHSIMELLMRYDVDPKTAKTMSMNELRSWPLEDITAILNQIKRPRRKYCPFQHPREFLKARSRIDRDQASKSTRVPRDDSNAVGNYFRSTWPSVYEPDEQWLCASRELLQKAIARGAALCINRKKEFGFRKDKYVAISHAWIEGLQREVSPVGIPASKIDLIFWSLSRQCIETEWIWVDGLSVPGAVTESSTVADDLLKIQTINTLADVYANADGIAIFDAMTWQLESSDIETVGVVLTCGLWASRIWTYQEIKLAKKAYIITSGPKGKMAPEWSEITKYFCEYKERCPDLAKKFYYFYAILHDKARYGTIGYRNCLQADVLQNVRLSIRDLVGECQARETGYQIDYARAFFPALGLKWKLGTTREEAMQEIYYSQKWEATRTIFYYGCPRMSIRPGWMPSTLVGLEGEVTEGLKYETRGIRGVLEIAKVSSLRHKFQRLGKWAVNCDVGDTQTQFVIHESERAGMIEEVTKEILAGRLYILRPSEDPGIQRSTEFAKTAVLAIKATVREVDGFECAILCAILLNSPVPFPMQQIEVLIRHGAFDSSGIDLDNHLQYYFQNQAESRTNDSATDGDSELHKAVRSNDLKAVQACLRDGADAHELNGEGLSALHIAASWGHDAIMAFLLSVPDVNVNLPSGDSSKRPPLQLAAEQNHPSIIHLLKQYGVNLELRQDGGYTALMTASYEGSLEAVQALLALKADPNANGSGICRETPLKLTCGRTYPTENRLALAKALLDAGADPNGVIQDLDEERPQEENSNESEVDTVLPYIWPALHKAVEWSSTDVVRLLLQRGADPNIPKSWPGFSPLAKAIEKNRLDLLQMLIDAGGKCDIQLPGGGNLLHQAAKCHDYQILQVLLKELSTSGSEKLVQLLDAKLDEGGWTPLMIAQKQGTSLVQKLLKEAKANEQ